MGKEVKMYALHITQRNSLMAICNKRFLSIMKKHEAYPLAQDANPDPVAYLATLLFRTDEQRQAFGRECEKMGIDFAYESKIAYSDEIHLVGKGGNLNDTN